MLCKSWHLSAFLAAWCYPSYMDRYLKTTVVKMTMAIFSPFVGESNLTYHHRPLYPQNRRHHRHTRVVDSQIHHHHHHHHRLKWW